MLRETPGPHEAPEFVTAHDAQPRKQDRSDIHVKKLHRRSRIPPHASRAAGPDRLDRVRPRGTRRRIVGAWGGGGMMAKFDAIIAQYNASGEPFRIEGHCQ